MSESTICVNACGCCRHLDRIQDLAADLAEAVELLAAIEAVSLRADSWGFVTNWHDRRDAFLAKRKEAGE